MSMKIRVGLLGLVVGISLLASLSAHARVIVHGTRQIFPGEQQEISVRTENVGAQAALVQAWVDDGDKQAGPEEVKTPFVLRPPIYRLDAGKSQVIRVSFTGAPQPQDRESVYWLNILDIPPSPEAGSVSTGNYLQFSLRTRIKLIYRPKGLNSPLSAVEKLQWELVPEGSGWGLKATNSSPYYVHFSALGLHAQGKTYAAKDFPMIAPMSTHTYLLDGLNQHPGTGDVQFMYINDQGGVAARSVDLSSD
ncbi:molecular chaperone [Oceanisphaera sp. KMM 10153]|uniref:fimbrial biogenesis chaperone n=1 Tax=Oceanisphaera submarina TaxID=3390193 RepID=UPI00397526D5